MEFVWSTFRQNGRQEYVLQLLQQKPNTGCEKTNNYFIMKTKSLSTVMVFNERKVLFLIV